MFLFCHNAVGVRVIFGSGVTAVTIGMVGRRGCSGSHRATTALTNTKPTRESVSSHPLLTRSVSPEVLSNGGAQISIRPPACHAQAAA